jgi:hypothetical protein
MNLESIPFAADTHIYMLFTNVGLISSRYTERLGQVGRTRASKASGSNLGWEPAILTEVFQGFALSLQQNSRLVPQIRSPPLPSTSFITHHSLIILKFDAT